jgi:hypothetical protein
MTNRQALEEWLFLANQRYKEAGVEHAARPWKAVSEYSIEFRHSFIMGRSGPDEFIFEWFKQRSKTGSQEIGSLYESAFYYDGCFWGLRIPFGFGSFCLELDACVGEMPEVLKRELSKEMDVDTVFSRKLLEHWSNCIDYAYGLGALVEGEVFKGLALTRIESADQDIRAANHLLLVDKANPICAQSYRFAAEKLLKAAGWHAGAITSEEEEQRRFNHGLKDLAKACAQKTGAQFFEEIPASVSTFPRWSSRYEKSEKDNASLWQATFLAQSIAADIVRLYSDRNSKAQICPWTTSPNVQPSTPPIP